MLAKILLKAFSDLFAFDLKEISLDAVEVGLEAVEAIMELVEEGGMYFL